MKVFTLTLILTALLAYTGEAIGQNSRAYESARASLARINFLVKNGPTDTDALEIERIFDCLPRLRRQLTSEQQAELWRRYPFFAGIACNWPVGHDFHGNDCVYQCGTFAECMKGVSR
jgi:hypothetical protein